jgi:PAT family beta-lactamase induction signal transducer AmpG
MSIPRKPGIFIPTLYFAEGLPYTIVMQMSGIFFKSLGASNDFIGLMSSLSLPWTLKFMWSPLVDLYLTKRIWIVAAEFILSVSILGTAAGAAAAGNMVLDHVLNLSAVIMLLVALFSATHDISIDGYYLDVLNEEQKSLFVGIRNTAYRVAAIFGFGGMVFVAGKLAESRGLPFGWTVAFALCAAAMFGCALFHKWYLPEPQSVGSASPDAVPGASDGNHAAAGGHPPVHVKRHVGSREFFQAIRTYFDQPGIGAIVCYILIFRLGDALMLKQAPNFLLDPPSKTGLGVSVADMGMVSGTAGVISLLVGGILASWLISRYGLRRWLWPLALTQSGAILLYYVLAKWPAVFAVQLPAFHNQYLPAVYVINSAEQFAYGMGVSAYTVFLMLTVRSEYKAAHYATATAMMAFGVLVPGLVSGYLYDAVGYANFFLISFLASLPGIVAIYFLPLWREHTGAAAQAQPENKPATGKAS